MRALRGILLLSSAVLAAGWTDSAVAQVVPFAQGNGSGSQQQFANEVINESVNTTTLFASQDIFSTGSFSKRSSDQPDTHYDTARTPFEVKLSDGKGRWQPFVYGSGALLKVTSGASKPPGAEGQDDFSTSHLFAVAGGLGSYLRVSDDFKLSVSCAVTFSHLRNTYDFNNSYSQRVLEPDSDLYYNWDLNLFTYSPTAKAIYESHWGESIANLTVGYSELFNDSVDSSSPAINIDSATGIFWSRASYTEPTGVDAIGAATSLRPFFQWSNINGKAAKGLDLFNLYEVGADVVFDFKEKFLLFSQMYWGGSYVTGDSFEGYHIGFGGKF